MQRSTSNLLTTFLALLVCSPVLLAQESAEPGADGGPPSMRGLSAAERRAIWDTLSEEDKAIVRERRRVAREQHRKDLQAMTPEERENWRAEMQARAAELTPEQRQAARERREKSQGRNRPRSAETPASEKAAEPPAADPKN